MTSPTITSRANAKMPAKEMWRKARTRVSWRSITWRRKPVKLPAPAEPASTQVVVPARRASRSASTPSEVPPE